MLSISGSYVSHICLFNKFCIHVEFCSHHHKIQNKDFKKSNTGLASIIQARRKKMEVSVCVFGGLQFYGTECQSLTKYKL